MLQPIYEQAMGAAIAACTVVRDILGHSQIQITQESYQRTDASTMNAAMKALEAHLS